ncbi:hypothetical protein N7486_005975 [Penicillium sp. IBT 16267x]|nr:hypothetical protein N7486_005975 [Penicillium sp. IBT 16267x]
MPTDLVGWHPGEVAVQRKLGFSEAVRTGWQLNEDLMHEQHRIFHTSNLPFIPITILDDQGRPWASILAGSDGEVGFVLSPNSQTLTIKTRIWEGEPLQQILHVWLAQKPQTRVQGRFLTAGLGIEFPTRRRNKFAGWIEDVNRLGSLDYNLTLIVNQSMGNCPKYINIRSLVPHPDTQPEVIYNERQMSARARLPTEIIDFITKADTVFIGTIYEATPSDENCFPSHAGMNARGGLPGFIRVRPSNGRTIVLPDYSGNRFLSSLGNIYQSGVAALTIVGFTTGDILYVTGQANVLIGSAALALMPRQATVSTIELTGYIFVRDALPVRQKPGSNVERSPYSPPIKYLFEEQRGLPVTSNVAIAHLTNATQIAHDIATLHFEVLYRATERLTIKPGQAVALNFVDWMGLPDYQHMAADAPGSLNDDRIRTWTISSAHESQKVTNFNLTMREKKGGAVTTALFNIIREQAAFQSRLSNIDLRNKNIKTPVIGITGDFSLSNGNLSVLWVAGGIGITPFLAMLAALRDRGSRANGEIILALATPEPAVFLQLINTAFPTPLPNLRVRVDIFTSKPVPPASLLWKEQSLEIVAHKGRIQPNYWKTVAYVDEVYICGPGGFGDTAVGGLRAAGIPHENIFREGFF